MKLYEYCGKQVKITLDEDEFIVGKCMEFTKAIYNDPEIASIDVKVKGDIYEIYENEIKKIEIV
nr:hypothetical protein [Tissierella sp.]